jgi:hypothetical protein
MTFISSKSSNVSYECAIPSLNIGEKFVFAEVTLPIIFFSGGAKNRLNNVDLNLLKIYNSSPSLIKDNGLSSMVSM